MTDEKDPRNKRYYHGGDDGLKIGEYILPPNDTGKDNMIGMNPLRRKDRVYLIKDIAGAMWFASRSDNPMVYEVTPEDDLEDDPDHKIKGISFACPKAKIIALHNVPPDVILRNRLQMQAIALAQKT
jgi:rifampin ADP-ribosylating transferase